MVLKQFELPGRIDDDLIRAASKCGLSESEVVQEALQRHLSEIVDDSYVVVDAAERNAIFRAGAGMWKDRSDLPDFAAMRDEWDERLPRWFDHE